MVLMFLVAMTKLFQLDGANRTLEVTIFEIGSHVTPFVLSSASNSSHTSVLQHVMYP